MTDATYRTDDLTPDSWTHIGRVWTNGEPFLALDAGLLAAWRGSEEQFEELVSLGWEVTAVQVGKGIAGIVATDGTVNDEGWLEIFQADSHDRLAVVQALGDPYRRALRDALAYPNEGDDDGGVIAVPSGELVLWSSALDGIDDVGTDLRGAAPGSTPDAWESLHSGARHPGGLQIPVHAGAFRLQVRWMTELDGVCFARWLLTSDA